MKPTMALDHAIRAALDCEMVCAETLMHCLSEGGDHAEPTHISTMLDCIAMCQTNAGFMVRGSDMHLEVCRVCAEVCDQCAVSCGEFEDETMDRCADACRACAEACRHMVGAPLT